MTGPYSVASILACWNILASLATSLLLLFSYPPTLRSWSNIMRQGLYSLQKFSISNISILRALTTKTLSPITLSLAALAACGSANIILLVQPIALCPTLNLTFLSSSSLLNHTTGLPLKSGMLSACGAMWLTSEARKVVFPVSGLAAMRHKSPTLKGPRLRFSSLSLQSNPLPATIASAMESMSSSTMREAFSPTLPTSPSHSLRSTLASLKSASMEPSATLSATTPSCSA